MTQKTVAPSGERARCSLIGETQRFAVGHSLGETPVLVAQRQLPIGVSGYVATWYAWCCG